MISCFKIEKTDELKPTNYQLQTCKAMEKADFENLYIWQKAMDYADFCLSISEQIVKKQNGHYRVLEQLESSALSIPQNIAEGKGRNSTKEFLQFLYYSRGSLNESLTVLLVIHKRKWINDELIKKSKTMAYELGSMINSFINGLRRKIK